MPEDENLALVLRELLESAAKVLAEVEAGLGLPWVGKPDLFGRDRSAGAHVIERGVSGDAHDPRRKGDLALLVLLIAFISFAKTFWVMSSASWWSWTKLAM